MLVTISDEAAVRRVGTTLRDKWVLEELLGIGGMASVYRARHKIGRRDAIKILHPEVAASDQLRARFEQEAHAVNAFRHPGVVEIRDVDTTDDGAPFLVMELLEGESLADRIARPPPLEPREILELGAQTLDVLAAAHARGIIHRDIKPDNLFLGPNGRVKVLDFGIARVRSSERRALTTKAGVTLGTMQYMAPEQARGEEIDGRADVYAAGATMWKLLTERNVHAVNSEVELLMKAIGEHAPRLRSVKPDVAPDIAAVIDRSLVFDRAFRYPDAQTMLGDLRAVLDGRPPPHASSAPPIPEPPPPDSLFDPPASAQAAATVPPPKLRAAQQAARSAPNAIAIVNAPPEVAPISPLAIVSSGGMKVPPPIGSIETPRAGSFGAPASPIGVVTPQAGSFASASDVQLRPTVLSSGPALAAPKPNVASADPNLPDLDAAVAASASSPTRISDGALPAEALPSQRSWPTRVGEDAIPPEAVASQRVAPALPRVAPAPPVVPLVKTPFGQVAAYVKARPSAVPMLVAGGIAFVALLGTLIAIIWFLVATKSEHEAEAPPTILEPAPPLGKPAKPAKSNGRR